MQILPFRFKPELSPKEVIEKVVQLKPEFDKLINYQDKLNFWYNNGFNIGVYTYGITDETEKKDLPENYITIYPETKEEKITYKRYYYNVFHNENLNTLQSYVRDYLNQIEKKGANPVPFTKKLIKEIDEYYKSQDRFPKTGHNSFRSYCNGYDASESGQIDDFLNDNSFHEHLISYFVGEAHEKFNNPLFIIIKLVDFYLRS
ncbi:MAG TPA: hypothetical protein VNZ49_17595 [Bacteroidia bacterium]|jgi:hypothetical protein|nr:hypothetical protein [Bacteroidia bacterium]